MSTLKSVSRLNCKKLIENCDKELAMIESEFELLARKDFVEFVHQGCKAQDQAPLKSSEHEFKQTTENDEKAMKNLISGSFVDDQK